MDYKDLIRRLDDCGGFDGDLLDDAAEAIETLLAERDAALDEFHGLCSRCKHFHPGPLEFPCSDCRFEGGESDHWKWRGPTKGGTQ